MGTREEPSKGGPGRKALPAGRGGVPDGDLAIASGERLAGVLHEVRNLLDGSLRYVLLARRTVTEAGEDPTGSLEQAARQLEVAAQAMQMMLGLTHAAMQGPGLAIGSMLLSEATPVTLSEAVRHALDVVRPMAEEHRVVLSQHVAPSLASCASGALYTVLLNGVRNGVESIARAGGGGTVQVTMLPGGRPRGKKRGGGGSGGEWVEIEIADDGEGTARGVGRSGGWGIGLALARSVVEEMGGELELRARPDGHDRSRPGAILRVVVPLPADGEERIGGAA